MLFGKARLWLCRRSRTRAKLWRSAAFQAKQNRGASEFEAPQTADEPHHFGGVCSWWCVSEASIKSLSEGQVELDLGGIHFRDRQDGRKRFIFAISVQQHCDLSATGSRAGRTLSSQERCFTRSRMKSKSTARSTFRNRCFSGTSASIQAQTPAAATQASSV